ncbi:MAG: glycyl-radical enzyme activating protein [Clostridiales bacterium]|jgi:pyruvate formate lyase activating enzyme|nr:glycyl-radical enzyme activating protein [Clostridiales bacterium]MDD3539651.1 glycyl-radical enzyme activating protein [Eubacteriales bacterium]MDD4186350.1 glycyl-radical enzyme activating protein [Eubacteriales bacterium]MDY0119002.1 glycyl-radical enzyme activating protein [Clostridia bacterium]NLG29732.1 glycyl-radical enzyme activating protein [Clostridiaceae bacterium]
MGVPLVFDLQRFSVHDGPGIRTTVFFKGCPLACEWCHNPESQSYLPEKMRDQDGALRMAGETYELDDFVSFLERDLLFYEQSKGGVTLSGGEPMAQDILFIRELLKRLKDKGISTAIDTSGFAPYESFQRVLPFTDLFLYDLKWMDDEKHRLFTGESNQIILENLRRLSEDGATICLRLPLLASLNDSIETMQAIQQWLKDHDVKIHSVNLLPYHAHAKGKYRALHKKWKTFKAPEPSHLETLVKLWQNAGYRTGMGGMMTGEHL